MATARTSGFIQRRCIIVALAAVLALGAGWGQSAAFAQAVDTSALDATPIAQAVEETVEPVVETVTPVAEETPEPVAEPVAPAAEPVEPVVEVVAPVVEVVAPVVETVDETRAGGRDG